MSENMTDRDKKELDLMREEWEIIKLANDKGKFAIELGATIDHQDGLESLLLRRWVTLIDVSPTSLFPRKLFRVFLLSPEAMEWRTAMQNKQNQEKFDG